MSNINNQSTPSNPSTPVRNKDHFFYYDALTDEEKVLYEQVRNLNNLDHEILLLRIKINQVLKNEPLDVSVLSSLVVTHNRLVKTNREFFRSTLSPFSPRLNESLAHYFKRLERDTSP